MTFIGKTNTHSGTGTERFAGRILSSSLKQQIESQKFQSLDSDGPTYDSCCA